MKNSKKTIDNLSKTPRCKKVSKVQQGKVKGGANTIIIEDTQTL